jgi:hypothetical protein
LSATNDSPALVAAASVKFAQKSIVTGSFLQLSISLLQEAKSNGIAINKRQIFFIMYYFLSICILVSVSKG